MASCNIYQCCGYRYLSISNSKSYVYMNTISSKCAVNTDHLFQCHLFTQGIFFGEHQFRCFSTVNLGVVSVLILAMPFFSAITPNDTNLASALSSSSPVWRTCFRKGLGRLDDWLLFLSEKKKSKLKKKSEVSGIHFCKKTHINKNTIKP